MSLYLGKIHYWLFNKILWFENLEEHLIRLAAQEGLDIEEIEYTIQNKIGKKLENKNLEEIIDLNNIHGWLQNRIYISEGRMAAWIRFLLENNLETMSRIEIIFQDAGRLAAKNEEKDRDYGDASNIYTCLNNHILDGMPCDRVNIVLFSNEEEVIWERKICVHKDIWAKENISVQTFYNLRNIWIKSYINELNSDFNYVEEEIGKYKIKMRSKF